MKKLIFILLVCCLFAIIISCQSNNSNAKRNDYYDYVLAQQQQEQYLARREQYLEEQRAVFTDEKIYSDLQNDNYAELAKAKNISVSIDGIWTVKDEENIEYDISSLEIATKNDSVEMTKVILESYQCSDYDESDIATWVVKYNALKCYDYWKNVSISNWTFLSCVEDAAVEMKDIEFYKIITQDYRCSLEAIIDMDNPDFIDILFESKKFNPEQKDFLNAVLVNNKLLVEIFINQGFDINFEESVNITDSYEIPSNLPKRGYWDWDWYYNYVSLTPFTAASLMNNVDMMNYLIKQGVQKDYRAAVNLAIKGNAPDTFKLCLKSMPDLSEELEEMALVALEYESKEVLTEILKQLKKVDFSVDYGRDLNNISHPDDFTLLNMASYYGYLDIIKELIKFGANPNLIMSTRKSGNSIYEVEVYTPLSLAAEAGNHEAIKLLIELGAKVDLTDASGKLAIDYAQDNETRKLLRSFMN